MIDMSKSFLKNFTKVYEESIEREREMIEANQPENNYISLNRLNRWRDSMIEVNALDDLAKNTGDKSFRDLAYLKRRNVLGI